MTGSASNNGELLLSGAPMFLLGFYYETPERKANQVAEALEKMGHSGFNVVFSNPRLGETEFKSLLQQAHFYGIHVIGEDLPFVENEAKYSASPALLGWSIADDAGDHAPPEEIAARHRELKAHFPKHLTYLSISSWSKNIAENAWMADLIGIQCYPIDYPFPNPSPGMPNPLYEAYHVFQKAAREAYWHDKPAIANVQAFNWGEVKGQSGKRMPTPLEVRNMAWSAVAAGVKGLLFYSYDAGRSGVRHDPAVWRICQQFAREFKPLQSVAAAHRPTPLPTGDREVVAVRWATAKSIDFLIINTSTNTKKTVSLQLQAGTKGKMEYFLGDMRRTEHTLTGEVPPTEVAHLRIVTS